MVLNREELANLIKTYTNGRTDDETLSFIEDITDTLNSYNDVEERIKAVEEEWRERYKARFLEEIEAKFKEDEKNNKEIKLITTERLFKGE